MPALGVPASVVLSKPWNSKPEQRRPIAGGFQRRASFSPSPSSLGDYDLYDLLGLDCSSDQSQIKSAYRRLQKRCHPDITGPAGHDMAIFLNEAYALLSDPRSRSAYDEIRARTADLQGFTGRPLYSVWCGPETEPRAVFVDEVRCVGCLKCALVARKTFAIETVYGRARAVGQWADPEEKILDAIDACPVDCISIVDRSDLPALEHLMSKQPRGQVCASGAAAGGNVFSDAKKFQKRLREASREDSARDFAVRGIRSMANFWFRNSGSSSAVARLELTSAVEDHAKRLQDAAARRKAEGSVKFAGDGDEYWTPIVLPSPPRISADGDSIRRFDPEEKEKKKSKIEGSSSRGNRSMPAIRWIPEFVAAVAAGVAGADGGGGGTGGGLEQHIGGPAAVEIVNSYWLQALLAGIAWYIVAAGAVGLISLALGRTQD
ncbi:DNAJ heat shock N-terminal domain-containing protein [Wolffia australiana]